ncbi:MAG: hydroxyethylthiazole kinase [Thalassospira sp.]|uniref:hydroxyethylthiazole kinase n=1 Tax=Thalassospira sp. TaxID=1912094 RepID=UPI001B10199B|nr:hydroxyethylthiazole kinase [Thalassospira sp.]MBO6579831.1 hydroxyethylthiazole kinase [Thalassospira sp.]MBO6817717.1 hydroxyethylthiazole kinase [Thalassospira sp.]MBO6888371.1 hydroxyethylthiazole kinase [Thalassospira sp.]
MTTETSQTATDLFERMRATNPLVQCITNYVAMNYAANVLLAAGASPAMVHTPEESGEFAAIAGALTVNIGTLSPNWVEGMIAAAKAANRAGKPWVLDPVAHFATGYRRDAVAELLKLKPTVIRGNASEIIALGGGQSAGQGVDSGDPVEQAEEAARGLAIAQGAIVAITGEVDFVTDGKRSVRIAGGSDLMPKVTATGCSLTALVGAYLAIAPDQAFEATVAALGNFAVAGEIAANTANGPASFMTAFIDGLHRLDGATYAKNLRINVL